MDELSFEYYEKIYEYVDGGDMTHSLSVNHMPGSKAFSVKYLGMTDTRYIMEPKNRPSEISSDFIKKGDRIKIKDSKTKKTYHGVFVYGKKNKHGDFSEIKFIDDATNTLIEIKPVDVEDDI